MVELKRGPSRPLLEENDIVDARVSNVSEHEFKWDGKLVKKLKWFFTVTDQQNDVRGYS